MSEQKTRIKFIAFFILGIIVFACIYQGYYGIVQPALLPKLTIEQTYQNAIEDTMVAKSSEIYSSLTPVVESNANLIWQGDSGNKSLFSCRFHAVCFKLSCRRNTQYYVGRNLGYCCSRNQDFLQKHC